MRKIIFSLFIVLGLVGSLFAQSIEESNRRENLFSTFYAYVDDLNENYKREAEFTNKMRELYMTCLVNEKANLTIKGESTEIVDQKLSEAKTDVEVPVQVKIKSTAYSSDVEWDAPEVSYAKKLNNVYEFEFVVSKENLGPALVAFCAGLRGFFDDTNYSDEEEIPGVSNEDLIDCYNLVDIAANYFLDLLSNEECALIRQYCIDKVGLEVYQMLLEDLE